MSSVNQIGRNSITLKENETRMWLDRSIAIERRMLDGQDIMYNSIVCIKYIDIHYTNVLYVNDR